MNPIGLHCPVELPSLARNCTYIGLFGSVVFDDKKFETGERITAFHRCPKCELWWPCVQEPCAWAPSNDGFWRATGWRVNAVCGECD